MDVRSLRRKRIAIILTIVVALGALVGVVYVVQKKQSIAQATAQRAAGMEAYDIAEYAAAIEHLGPYVEQHSRDAEAWAAFGRAHLRAPQPDQSNIGRAYAALRHAHDLNPDDPGVAGDLLELCVLVQDNERALDLADRVLRQTPDATPVRLQKVVTLARLGRNEEALRLGSELLADSPENLELQLIVLQLRHSLGQPPDQILADARAQAQAHPDDPRYQLILGVAYALSGDRAEAARRLRAAIDQPLPSDVPLLTVVRLLDQAALFGESLHVLVTQVTAENEPALIGEKVRRSFEAGLVGVVNQALADIDVTAPDADVQMAAIGVIAAHSSGDLDRAGRIIDALAARQDDPRAGAWARVLRALSPRKFDPTAADVDILSRAVTDAPRSAYLHSLLGDAYAAADELALAAEQWQTAAELRPVWDAPRRQLARYYLSISNLDQAARYAEESFIRRPNSVDAAFVLAQVRAARLTPGDIEAHDQLIDLLDNIDQNVGSPFRTITLRVSTLASLGQIDAARRVVRDAIDQQVALPPNVVAQLTQFSRQYELGLDDQLASLSSSEGSPQAITDQAMQLAEQGRAEESRALIEQHRTPGNVAWDVGWAQVLDAIGDPQAAATWTSLSAQYAGDARVQVLALRSDALADNPQAMNQIVERLRNITGEAGAAWRIEQARWLLARGGGGGEALTLLREVLANDPNHFEAKLLSAWAHQQEGRLQLAVRQLQSALTQRPGALSVKLDLAMLFQQMHAYEQAAEQLNQVTLDPAATPDIQRRAAMMLAQQGSDTRAIAVLEELSSGASQSSTADDLLLASLYRRTGQADKTEAACRRLLDNPTAGGILFVAGYYADGGREDEARAALDRLDSLDMTPADKHMTLAAYFSQFGSPDEALVHYRAAAEAAPTNREHWRRLVGFELVTGQPDAALADARRAIAQLDDSPGMRAVVDHASLVRRLAGDPLWRPLVVSIVTDPATRQIAVEALTKVAAVSPDDPAAQAEAIGGLVRQHQQFLPLQLAAARAYMAAGRTDTAAELAKRAMYANPASVDAAWLAAEALSAEQRWSEALIAASQWRQRSASRSITADLIIAEARLRMGEVDAAMREIQPHLHEALADPQANAPVIAAHVRGLVANGQTDEARRILEPLLDTERRWRLLWASLASLAIDDATVAAQWLTALEPHIPADADEEAAEMAQHWWWVYSRSDAPAHRQAAVRWIDRAVAGDDVAPTTWVLKGILHETSGQLEQAEQAYRRALDLDGQNHVAANNLAMVILYRNGDLDEAQRLADLAVKGNPNNPDYLDTLARVHARAEHYDRAIDAIKRAVEADPGQARWQWTLLDLYQLAGRDEDAMRLRNQLQAQYPLGRPDNVLPIQ